MSTAMNIGVLGLPSTIIKRSFRWMMEIGFDSSPSNGVGRVIGNAVNILPPISATRPGMTFKEVELEHLTETIYRPLKANFKPMKVTIYDLASNLKNNLVFDWIVRYYNAKDATYNFVSGPKEANFLKTTAISLYSGDGCILESWVLEGTWIRDIEWGELNMDSNAAIHITLELRFDRGYCTVFNQNGKYVDTGFRGLDYGTGEC